MKFYQPLNETGLGETFLRASGASEDPEQSPVPPLISGLIIAYADSSEPLVSAFIFPEISRKLLFGDLYLLTFKQEKRRKF